MATTTPVVREAAMKRAARTASTKRPTRVLPRPKVPVAKPAMPTPGATR